jgi:hypothetical protein
MSLRNITVTIDKYELTKHDAVGCGEQYVLQLDVPMQDTSSMEVVEALEHLRYVNEHEKRKNEYQQRNRVAQGDFLCFFTYLVTHPHGWVRLNFPRALNAAKRSPAFIYCISMQILFSH